MTEQSTHVRGALAVVIPLANEEATVERLLAEVVSRLGPSDFLLCVFDRASRDLTRSLVDRFGEQDSRVRVVWAENSRCVADAYFAGYRAALETNAEWILEMDGGFSHQPSQISDFLREAHSGYDYVGGSRFMKGGSHEGPWKRAFVSRAGSLLARVVLRQKMSDFTSGFQLYRRELLKCIVDRGVASRAHFFQTEIRYFVTSWKWKEIPIRYGRTTSPLPRASISEALVNLWALARDRRHRPTGRREEKTR